MQARYSDSLVVDAGRVGDEQLHYFGQLMDRLRKELGTRYNQVTKIALLHHHVSHLWRQQLEVKRFEAVVDAADLKLALTEHGFNFVLHGPLDGSLMPVGSATARAPICIVCGGTVAGYATENEQHTFKLLSFKQDHAPRVAAIITEVPLLQSTAPEQVLHGESKTYQVSLETTAANIHDFARMKERLDEVVRDRCAPELRSGEGLILWGARAQLPPGDPELVGRDSRYELDRIIDGPMRLLYDVILAVRALGFRQRARVFWLLTDVKPVMAVDHLQVKVILLIGDLEGTAMSEIVEKGEVSRSIDELKAWFRPALESGLLEVRTYKFKAEEVAALSRMEAARR